VAGWEYAATGEGEDVWLWLLRRGREYEELDWLPPECRAIDIRTAEGEKCSVLGIGRL
jgi:hypothetical protein